MTAFQTLQKFITEEMMMSQVYQPVMLIELLKGGGVASNAQIAHAILCLISERDVGLGSAREFSSMPCCCQSIRSKESDQELMCQILLDTKVGA